MDAWRRRRRGPWDCSTAKKVPGRRVWLQRSWRAFEVEPPSLAIFSVYIIYLLRISSSESGTPVIPARIAVASAPVFLAGSSRLDLDLVRSRNRRDRPGSGPVELQRLMRRRASGAASSVGRRRLFIRSSRGAPKARLYSRFSLLPNSRHALRCGVSRAPAWVRASVLFGVKLCAGSSRYRRLFTSGVRDGTRYARAG